MLNLLVSLNRWLGRHIHWPLSKCRTARTLHQVGLSANVIRETPRARGRSTSTSTRRKINQGTNQVMDLFPIDGSIFGLAEL